MKTIALAAALLAATATAGAAAEWLHASAPMGQYEGQLRISDTNNIGYSCTFSSSVSFTVPGDQAGPVVVTVDGNPVRYGELESEPQYGTSSVEFKVENEDPKSALYGYNYLIHSMAEGGEVSLRQGDETLGTWTLAGSRDITNCAVFIDR